VSSSGVARAASLYCVCWRAASLYCVCWRAASLYCVCWRAASLYCVCWRAASLHCVCWRAVLCMLPLCVLCVLPLCSVCADALPLPVQDLLKRGFKVIVVSDGVSSQKDSDRQTALAYFRGLKGAPLVSLVNICAVRHPPRLRLTLSESRRRQRSQRREPPLRNHPRRHAPQVPRDLAHR
jgi:hypothetical protein